jgi:hypothetical protein
MKAKHALETDAVQRVALHGAAQRELSVLNNGEGCLVDVYA